MDSIFEALMDIRRFSLKFTSTLSLALALTACGGSDKATGSGSAKDAQDAGDGMVGIGGQFEGGSSGDGGGGGTVGADGSAGASGSGGNGGGGTGGEGTGGAGTDGGGGSSGDETDGGSGGTSDDGGAPCTEDADCDNADACDGAEQCVDGSCEDGTALDCDDSDSCTTDVCDPQSGCEHTTVADGTACDDASACTTGETCSAGVCGGGSATTCDDGNACTDDTCDPGSGCVYSNNTFACDDGDPCTTGDVCSNGACTPGTTPTCDDANECTVDICDEVTGACTNPPHADGVACTDDGNPCTLSTCLSGQCNAPVASGSILCRVPSCTGASPNASAIVGAYCEGTDTCPTQVTNSCGAAECNGDGTACEGDCGTDINCPIGSFCDASGDCSEVGDLGDPCIRGGQCGSGYCTDGVCCESECGGGDATDCVACDQGGGLCAPLSATSCDDGSACSTGDTCDAGACGGGTAVDCDDGNPCTADSCDAVAGCLHTPVADGTGCDDGSACTSGDMCTSGVCGGSAVTCNDGDVCTDDSCDPGSGCMFTNNTAPCDDGNACTTGDICGGGSCQAGTTPLTCDDGNGCTDDSCDPGTGCVFTNNTASCDDGNACTTGDTCGGGSCQTGTIALTCDDGNGCTDDSCDPGTGCVFTNNTVSCDDGNACTTGDTCGGGSCQSGSPVTCNDTNNCTDDSCNPSTGCVFTNNTSPCDNGDFCTENDVCSAGVCTAGTAIECDNGIFCDGQETCEPSQGCVPGTTQTCSDDGYACTREVCDIGLDACVSRPQDSVCADGQFCNGAELCMPAAAGADAEGCIGGIAPDCQDGVGCTQDSCDEANDRCLFAPDHAACDDNDVCNGTEVCDPALDCVEGTPLSCDDQIFCTDNSCDAILGCQSTPNNANCQNANYCDGEEVCDPGDAASNAAGCRDGADVTCSPSDAVACTQDVCDEATDSCVLVLDNSQCTGGDACTVSGCGTPCTDSSDCDDLLACNGVETCVNGKCVAGTPPLPCDDGISCTTDVCTEPSGACSFIPDDEVCADGDACNGDETCSATLDCQAGSPPDCDDGVGCTSDVCFPGLGGCFNLNSNALCNDGQICNGTEICNPSASGADADGCLPGVPLTCAGDGIACTNEVCSETAGGCRSVPDNTLCPCNETCEPSQGGCGDFCVISECQGKVYECGDCKPNDAVDDCLVDSADPSCFGPCDNNEDGFKGEIPGQNNAPCKMDCYFDGDTGSGNDDCFWNRECDPYSEPMLCTSAADCPSGPCVDGKGNNPDYCQDWSFPPSNDPACECDETGISPVPQPGDPAFPDCSASTPGTGQSCSELFYTQSSVCTSDSGSPPAANVCGSLVPNGCDCFGCCEVPLPAGGTTTVFLGSETLGGVGSCTIDELDDPTACHPCHQVVACLNTCETCEVCIGKPQLPPECTCQTCEAGEQLCGAPCGTPCPDGFFCKTGCCAPNPTN